jgi:flagellar FliL protein
MSDDFLEGDDDVLSAEGSGGKESKQKVGFLPAIVIQVLKWGAIILGLIIFVVTVVIVTLNIIGAGGPGQARTDITEDYQQDLPVYSYYALDELRGITSDEVRRTFVVEVQIGYDEGDDVTLNEILKRKVPMTDILLGWFSDQRAAYLLNNTNREEIRNKIKALLNRILTRDIREVRFTKFQVLDF